MKMAEIKFVPICSKCKQIVHEEVNITYKDVTHKAFVVYKIESIHPIKCSHCGTYFDSITMPINLPYKENT